MDSILYLGGAEEKLPRFLEKLGYNVLQQEPEKPLPELLATTNLDLVLVDGRISDGGVDLCAFIRSQESGKSLPIVYLSGDSKPHEARDLGEYSRIEVVDGPGSIGVVAGKIATQLRLRKFAGQDELKSTLAEMNAALRDHNARFKKELEEARGIQRGLLPAALPRNARLELAASYQPLEEVGGDWYFTANEPDGKVSLQIADVTGHGLSAAFVGSMAKLAMTAAAKQRPDELLEGMNRLMAPQIPAGRFVTMCSALYDPVTGMLQFARAGHPPGLLLRRAENKVVQLTGEGFAVGFFEDSTYTLVEDKMEVGDVFLMYTDGISEAQNRSMQTYGLDRLADALCATAPGAPAGKILEAVLDDFDAFREDRIVKDDVTLIVLKRLE